MLTNSYDGYEAVKVRFTPIRVVCENTLNTALYSKGIQARVRHIGNIFWQFKNAADFLGIATKTFHQTAKIYKSMAMVQLKQQELKNYLLQVIPDNPIAKNHTRTINIRRSIEYVHETGKGARITTSRGTVWGAYNAVSEYIDHARLSNTSPERRLDSMWFGSGDSIRKLAFDVAVSLL